jgi:hypothetical protein
MVPGHHHHIPLLRYVIIAPPLSRSALTSLRSRPLPYSIVVK